MVWSNEEDINAGFAAEGMDSCQQDTYDDVAATPNFINEDVVGRTLQTKTGCTHLFRRTIHPTLRQKMNLLLIPTVQHREINLLSQFMIDIKVDDRFRLVVRCLRNNRQATVEILMQVA